MVMYVRHHFSLYSFKMFFLYFCELFRISKYFLSNLGAFYHLLNFCNLIHTLILLYDFIYVYNGLCDIIYTSHGSVDFFSIFYYTQLRYFLCVFRLTNTFFCHLQFVYNLSTEFFISDDIVLLSFRISVWFFLSSFRFSPVTPHSSTGLNYTTPT